MFRIRYWLYCWPEVYRDCIALLESEKTVIFKICLSIIIRWWIHQSACQIAYNSAVYMSISSALASVWYICSDEMFRGLAWSIPNQHILTPTRLFLADISIYIADIVISLASSSAISCSGILTFDKSFYRAIIKGSIHSTFSKMACWYIAAILWRGDMCAFPLRFLRAFINFQK